MALASSSYGSVAEVVALTRHLLDGAGSFTSTTRPTLDDVEGFIDKVSAYLNIALKGHGISTPVTTTDGALTCDGWVISKAVAYVELTQRGEGFAEEDGSRFGAFWNLFADANDFAAMIAEGLKEDGVGVTDATSAGLAYTGINIHSQRSDPDNTTREQPLFRRRQFSP